MKCLPSVFIVAAFSLSAGTFVSFEIGTSRITPPAQTNASKSLADGATTLRDTARDLHEQAIARDTGGSQVCIKSSDPTQTTIRGDGLVVSNDPKTGLTCVEVRHAFDPETQNDPRQ